MCAGIHSISAPALDASRRAGPRRGRRCGCTTAGWRRSRAACRRSRRSSSSAWWASARRRRSPDSRQQADHRLARGERRLAGQLARTPRRPARRRARPASPGCRRPSRPITVRTGRSSSRHQVTSVRSPNVQHMAMPAPLSISASGVRDHRDLDAEDRRGDGGPEQRLVALVVGVRDQRDDAGDQLGPGRLDRRPCRRPGGGRRPGGRRRRSRAPRARPGRPRSGR